MNEAQSVLYRWIPWDLNTAGEVRALRPGDEYHFSYTSDNGLVRAELTYDEVQFVLARLTLERKLK